MNTNDPKLRELYDTAYDAGRRYASTKPGLDNDALEIHASFYAVALMDDKREMTIRGFEDGYRGSTRGASL